MLIRPIWHTPKPPRTQTPPPPHYATGRATIFAPREPDTRLTNFTFSKVVNTNIMVKLSYAPFEILCAQLCSGTCNSLFIKKTVQDGIRLSQAWFGCVHEDRVPTPHLLQKAGSPRGGDQRGTAYGQTPLPLGLHKGQPLSKQAQIPQRSAN